MTRSARKGDGYRHRGLRVLTLTAWRRGRLRVIPNSRSSQPWLAPRRVAVALRASARWRRYVSVALALPICSLGTAAMCRAAVPRRSDVVATRMYIGLRWSLVRAETSKLAAAQRKERSWTTEVRRQCGGALAGAPNGQQRVIFNAEIIGATVVVLVSPERQILRRYARSISRLGWSESQLSRLMRAEAREERAAAGLDAPHVCDDAHRWANSGFTEVSTGTRAFVGRFDRLLSASEPPLTIQRYIARYETPSEKKIVRATTREEKKDNRRLVALWVAGSRSVAHALGLSE